MTLCRLTGRLSLRDSGTSSAPTASGISLPEILIAMAVAGALFAVVGNLLLNHMMSASRLERGQRIREDANRFNYLMAVEAGEASSFSFNTPLQGCAHTGNALVAMTIPRPTGVYADAANVSRVYYYNSDGSIKRCGPPSNRNGVLNHGQPNITGEVARRTSLNVITSGGTCGRVSDSRTIVYNLTFLDAVGGDYSQCQIARAKTVFVCNPVPSPLPTGYIPQVGDC